MHGLWQGHTRAGRARGAAGGRPLPDRRARDGRALGAAAQGAGRRRSTRRSSRGRTSAAPPACTPCPGPRSATSGRSRRGRPVCLVPNGVDLAPFDDLPAAGRAGGRVPRACRASSSSSSSAGCTSRRGSTCWPRPWRRSAATIPTSTSCWPATTTGRSARSGPRCEALGVADRVTWVGHVSGERARRVWAAADAFVLPSYSEGFSMAVLEALACRLPVARSPPPATSPSWPRPAAGIVVEPTADGGRRPGSARPPRAVRRRARRARPRAAGPWSSGDTPGTGRPRRLAEVYRLARRRRGRARGGRRRETL